MKRVQALMLALLLAFTLCATGCNSTTPEPQATAEPEPTKEVIELTTGNWINYLKAKVRVSGSNRLCIELYPVRGGHFNNVRLTLRISTRQDWGMIVDDNHDEITIETKVFNDGSEGTYCYFNDIVLPASGEYTTSGAEFLLLFESLFDTSKINVFAEEISGTFVPD